MQRDAHIPFHPPTCYHLLILQTHTNQDGIYCNKTSHKLDGRSRAHALCHKHTLTHVLFITPHSKSRSLVINGEWGALASCSG